MAAAGCGSCAPSPSFPARSRRPRPRRCRRSATAPSSSSRTSRRAGTSRSRSSAPASTATGTAPCSAGTRRWSRRPRPPACRTRSERRCTRLRGRPPRRSTTAVPARSSSCCDPETERFFFLEMNTRLQVEHPVTELVHDVDLVELQIAAAQASWTMGWTDPPRSHAIEVRLYAEDPAADYQPQSGTLTTFEIPFEDGIRVDAGFESGSEVSTHYDAMLAKVIAHAPTREAAARKLASVPVPGQDPRAGDQPGPAGRDPAGREVPGRRREHCLPGWWFRGSLRSHLNHRGCSGCRGDRAGRAGQGGPHDPARHPGRLAQRGVAAAAHGVRGGDRRVARRSTSSTATRSSPRARPR